MPPPSPLNIVYVPYGNAQIDMDNKVVTCQHGDTECDLNTYEQCAIDVYPAAADYLPFIACLEGKRSLSRQPAQALADCSAEAGLDFAPVQECHDDEDRAWDLNVKNAGLTPADHQYTPWVELDGELYDDSVDFQTALCTAYTAKGGSSDACKAAIM
ncbi:hypothetical protein TeGR_g12617 [Tetraparma gracilis]|uniref:Gamma-interferon-inducible lysosomal thiol reductase n=1 Tax=Tetraparma gracilis TaxID=2962635 RepID=A0ABQ6NDM2_9STRA|nr:hypothetical protein TeGR_g12617 [Tetraparma gracilis]